MEFFENVRLYLKDQQTGLLEMRFICHKCGKEVEEPGGYTIHCAEGGVPMIHETKFYCEACYAERNKKWRNEKKM